MGNKLTGPFKDAIGHPFLARGLKANIYTIAPNVFIEGDGQAYLDLGSAADPGALKLRPDMVITDGDPVPIPFKKRREAMCGFKLNGISYSMRSINDARPELLRRLGYRRLAV
jgi:hypothetical protein